MSPEVKTIRIDHAVFQQTLEKKLADLPPLPVVVTKIMQTINNPNTSAEDLNRLISLDQSLSSKILRIVNSAYYGFPKRIGTITHAVVILGFNTVRNLVLGVSAFGMLSQKSGQAAINRNMLWEHSVATAVAASLLAKKMNPRTRNILEEAFIGGLLHDIGKLFLDCYFPMQYGVTMAYASRNEITILEAEQKVLDIDHAYIGRKIAEQWNFPSTLVASIGAHHVPMHGTEHFESSAIINAADWIAWQQNKGSFDQSGAPKMSQETSDLLEYTDEEMNWVFREWERQFAAAHELIKSGITS
jgi:putative nucleotidyltransferase with HDIG domain